MADMSIYEGPLLTKNNDICTMAQSWTGKDGMDAASTGAVLNEEEEEEGEGEEEVRKKRRGGKGGTSGADLSKAAPEQPNQPRNESGRGANRGSAQARIDPRAVPLLYRSKWCGGGGHSEGPGVDGELHHGGAQDGELLSVTIVMSDVDGGGPSGFRDMVVTMHVDGITLRCVSQYNGLVSSHT